MEKLHQLIFKISQLARIKTYEDDLAFTLSIIYLDEDDLFLFEELKTAIKDVVRTYLGDIKNIGEIDRGEDGHIMFEVFKEELK